MMTNGDSTSLSGSRELLAEIREQLQRAHFAARGFAWPDGRKARLSVPDQLHAIRVLAERLAAALNA